MYWGMGLKILTKFLFFTFNFSFDFIQRPRMDSNKKSLPNPRLPNPRPEVKSSVWVRSETFHCGTSHWVSSVASILAVFLANLLIMDLFLNR